MKFFKLLPRLFAAFGLVIMSTSLVEGAEVDFNLPYYSVNLKGDMTTLGNTIIWKDEGGVANAYGVDINTSTPNNRNNAYTMRFIDVLSDGNKTFNSSSSRLSLTTGYTVVWAGLYWQGHIVNKDTESDADNSKIGTGANNTAVYNDAKSKANKVYFRRPDGVEYNLTAQVLYDYYENGTNRYLYSGFYNVTSYVQSGGDGNYSVGNIRTSEGQIDTWGGLGGWAMLVIYKDPSGVLHMKNVSVFHGYQILSSGETDQIDVSGFVTPKSGTINASIAMFTVDGDKFGSNNTGERLKMWNTSSVLTDITNGLNPLSNVFNSSITNMGSDNVQRTPFFTDTLGLDLDRFDVSSYMKHDQQTTKIEVSTSGDLYAIDMIAFATDLYEPKLCYDYSYRQDGAYLKADNNGSMLPTLTGTISDSKIDVSVYLRNIEADIDASKVSFYTSDVNATLFDYVDNSISTSNINGSSLIPRDDSGTGCDYNNSATTPIGCVYGSNVRIGLGQGATGYSINGAGNFKSENFAYTNFSLQPKFGGLADVNESLGLSVDYVIRPLGATSDIPYNYKLGVNMAMCPPASAYAPQWGTFNVVEGGASLLGSGLPVNNIRTKVSRNPFTVDVAGYGKNASTQKYDVKPTANINTTLLVEAIDSGAYHDANATCANPASSISPVVYVPYTYSTATGDPTVSVPLQNVAFHNFAVKNGAFRLWYFDDVNGTLIQNWTATTSDSTRLNLTSISGLYKSGTHTVCATECAASTSVACFNCIKANYAKPLCSRDNFAVRPESYDVRLYDVNQALAPTDPVKDSTKIAVSEQYQYPPTYAASLGKMPLAAGYVYRYDLNATGHDTDLSRVPGYTRYFNNADPEYTATMIRDWNTTVKAGCNDIDDKPISFYVASGQLSNLEHRVDQVGEYKFNVYDTSWTEVDWKTSLIGHHTLDNGFIDGDLTDCAKGFTYSVPVSGTKIGCNISSNHSNTATSQTYKDPLVKFKPAKFDLSSITYGLGMNATSIATGGAGFVYDSNLSITNDMPMALRTLGSIKALGENNTTLSNFVTQCYASDINVSVSHNAPDANATFSFIGRIDSNATYNATASPAQTVSESSFAKANNGATSPTIRLNVNRDVRMPQLPLTVHYNDINVSCANVADCNVSAMSLTTPNMATGSDLMDFNVTHVYGRVVPSSVRVMGLIAFETIARYEAYMTPTLLGTALVTDPVENVWNINTLHTEAEYGDATVGYVDPTAGSSLPVVATSTYLAGVESYRFNPYTIRQNYKGHINTEGWLWYNTNASAYVDPAAGALSCLTHPCFDITFGRLVGNTGSAKTQSEAHKANKKTSTGTGWSTTSEYAPSIR